MANTASAKKAIRSQATKYVKNLRHKRAFRDARKEVVTAADSKDAKAVQEALSKFYKEVDKAAKVNAIHANAAARYKSRLAQQVNKTMNA